MIDIDRLISDFESALGYPYVSPGTTQWSKLKQGVDCSGLFTAAYRRQGASLPHGSNAIARQHTRGMSVLKGSSQLCRGCAVFKWRQDGAPSKYTDGKGNWHHIGLVVSVSPLRIIHAGSAAGKVTADSSLKGWTHTALLKAVNYTKGETMMEKYLIEVRASVLRVRAQAGTKSAIAGSLKKGARRWADKKENGWYHLADGTGWVSGSYVKPVKCAAADPETDGSGESRSTSADADRLTALEARVSALEALLQEDEHVDEP